MRIAMFMRWEGVTLNQYDEVRERVDWEGNVPEGAVLHICSHDGDALRITDVWESAEDFNNFVKNRLMPGVKEAGISGEPQVEIFPLHALFAPNEEEEEFEEEEIEEVEA
jgi:hypothetical protein